MLTADGSFHDVDAEFANYFDQITDLARELSELATGYASAEFPRTYQRNTLAQETS